MQAKFWKWPLRLVLLVVALGILSSGCRVVQTAADIPGHTVRAVTPGKKEKNAVDLVDLEQSLMRFTDEFSASMVFGIDQLRRGTNRLDAAEVLKWKIALTTETCAIVSGPNPIADLLDMTVLVTVTREAVEEVWVPREFGDSAEPLLNSCRNAETNIWALAGRVLNPDQLAELRAAIEAWHGQHPLSEGALSARAVGLVSEVLQADKADQTKPGSLFSVIGLDPLAGLDPAAREIAKTRLFAERALYVTQKMPTLLRWQTELLSLNSTQLPAVQQLITNSTSLAASVDRVASVAEKLPDQISTERAEVLQAMQSQEKDIASLMNSGTLMSDSLNTTLTTLDALMKRLGVGETNKVAPAPTNSEPFRIQDYTLAAAQLEGTARQLTELLVTLDQTLGSTNLANLTAQASPAIQQAQASGRDIVDYAFWKGVLLVVIVLLAALIYRFLVVRLIIKTDSKPNSP